jgi:hypothetical protein
MDPFKPETWKQQWDAFMTAPYLLMPLIIAALILGWWIGKRLASAGLDGLNGTIDNLRANIGVLEARLDFASDREKDVHRTSANLEKQIQDLTAQIAAGASNKQLIATSAKVDVAITQFSTANNALATALTAQNMTTASPNLGRPSLTEKSD